jgi:ribonuclease Y
MSFFDHSTLLGAACLAAGTGAGYWLVRWKDRNIRKALAIRQQAELEAARREAENIAREARLRANEDALRLREETERSFTARAQSVDQMEKRLIEREAIISHQLETMVRQEKSLAEQHQGCARRLEGIEAQREELATLARQRRCALEEMARLSTPDARALLLKEVEMETLQDASNLTRRLLEEARAHAEDKARRVISLAIQRYSGIHTFETTSSTVTLPNEELKGRIIGREGRNIRAFENAPA